MEPKGVGPAAQPSGGSIRRSLSFTGYQRSPTLEPDKLSEGVRILRIPNGSVLISSVIGARVTKNERYEGRVVKNERGGGKSESSELRR